MGMTIEEFSDREFLLILRDMAEADGWAGSHDIADHLNFSPNGSAHRSVACRLSWLHRYGVVEREHERDEHGQLKWRKGGEPMYTQRWRLTPKGEAVALGQVRKAAQSALEGLTEEELLVATRIITSKQREASEVGATLVRREWRYGTSKLRNGR
jgi:hypothetical protein